MTKRTEARLRKRIAELEKKVCELQDQLIAARNARGVQYVPWYQPPIQLPSQPMRPADPAPLWPPTWIDPVPVTPSIPPYTVPMNPLPTYPVQPFSPQIWCCEATPGIVAMN